MKWSFEFSRSVRSLATVEVDASEAGSLTEALELAQKRVREAEQQWRTAYSSAPEMEHWQLVQDAGKEV